MKVILRIGDPLAGTLGVRRVEVDVDEDNPTVATALDRFMEMYPQASKELLPGGHSAKDRLPYYLFLNHQKIAWEQVDEIRVQDGDKLALFLIVVGG